MIIQNITKGWILLIKKIDSQFLSYSEGRFSRLCSPFPLFIGIELVKAMCIFY